MSDAATTFAERAGVKPGPALAEAMRERSRVLAMTDAAEGAVLTPRDPGAWSHAMRAALAARIAQAHGLADIAEGHRRAAGSDPAAALADPGETGATLGPAAAAAAAFTDRVAAAPRDATAEDIAALREAGAADADIVRLAELNAFLAYEYRLIAGLRLLAGEAGR